MQVIPPTSRTPPRPPLTPARPPLNGASAGTLGLALAAGLAASLLAFLLLRGHAKPAAAAPVSVVVAARLVPSRARLTAPLLTLRRLPPSAVPDGALTATTQAVGKITTRPLPAGAPITREAVTEGTAALGMAFTLPPSRRAVTVALDPTDSAGDFVRPGDRVDILVTDEPGRGPAEVRTVLQNIPLLAVGSQTSPTGPPPPPDGAGPGHVTVSVSLSEAQALVLAAARGKIHLALRAVDDNGVSDTAPLPAAPPDPEPPRPAPSAASPRLAAPKLPLVVRPQKPAPPAQVTILVIKGSQSQTVTVAP